METTDGTRINKFLSEAGHCSRREADRLVDEGRVTINGRTAYNGDRVLSKNIVTVDGEIVSKPKEDFVYLAFHKPAGIVCTTDTKNEKNNIIDYIHYEKRIFPVGRLDKDSEGLIIMTNDGDIVNKILRAHNDNEKEYLVTIDRPVTEKFVKQMAGGVPIMGATTKKCKVEKVNKFAFSIVLTQGLNRQIRRMTEYCGAEVIGLKRTRIMNIKLDIHVGGIRELTPDEMEVMNQELATASKTKKQTPGRKKKHSVVKAPTSNRHNPRDKKGKSGTKRFGKKKVAKTTKNNIGKSKRKKGGRR